MIHYPPTPLMLAFSTLAMAACAQVTESPLEGQALEGVVMGHLLDAGGDARLAQAPSPAGEEQSPDAGRVDGGPVEAAIPPTGKQPAASTCLPTAGQDLTCDGIDDDCDGLVDEAAEPMCLDTDTLQACGQAQPSSCAAQNQTCLAGLCRGICAAEQLRCAGARQSQRCDLSGAWVDAESCEASSVKRCDSRLSSPSYGTCIDDGVSTVGHSFALGTSVILAEGDLVAQPVVLDRDARLLGFGMRTPPVSIAGGVWLSLHVDADGQPGTHLRNGASILLKSDSDNYTPENYAPPIEDTYLYEGTRYWIVASVNSHTSTGVQVYSYPAGGDTEPHRLGQMPFGFPGNMTPGATTAAPDALSLYIRVEPR